MLRATIVSEGNPHISDHRRLRRHALYASVQSAFRSYLAIDSAQDLDATTTCDRCTGQLHTAGPLGNCLFSLRMEADPFLIFPQPVVFEFDLSSHMKND